MSTPLGPLSIRGKGIVALGSVVALVLSGSRHASADQPSLLNVAVGRIVSPSEKVPFTQALQAVAMAVQDGYVLYGAEVRLEDGKEPTVKLNLEHPGNLGDALRSIFIQLPNYQFEAVSNHFISVYPKGAKEDPDDILNLRVPRFDVDDERSGVILTWPERFVPELKRRLTPRERLRPGQIHADLYVGAVAGGPLLHLHLVNVSVREILDATSRATERFVFDEAPTGWIYSFQYQPSSPLGGVHSWRLFLTLPSNWLQQAEKSRTR